MKKEIIDKVFKSSINNLTLQNLTEEEREGCHFAYYGEIYLGNDSVGRFRQKTISGFAEIEADDRTLSFLKSLCQKYYKVYPPMVEVMEKSVECMITELLYFTLAEYYFAPAIVLFLPQRTTILHDDGSESLDAVKNAVVCQYNYVNSAVRMFRVPSGGMLLTV